LRIESAYRYQVDQPLFTLPERTGRAADQPDFINAVALIETHLTPPDLLNAFACHRTASTARARSLNAPRTLDLDILLYYRCNTGCRADCCRIRA